jgi:hypothetical protein
MDAIPKTRWRFSLRSLLALAVPVALCGVAYHYLGAVGFVGTLFAIVSIGTAALLTGKHRRTYLTSYCAAYGPFLAMALYTSAFVECSHCKLACWELLPSGPALIPLMLLYRLLDLPAFHDPLGHILAFAVSAAMVAVLACLLHGRRRWLQAVIAGLALAWNCFSAYALLSLIRA